jgi:transitional endoplasmic reticulum ATPase
MNLTVTPLHPDKAFQSIAALGRAAREQLGVSPNEVVLLESEDAVLLGRVARAKGRGDDSVALDGVTRGSLKVDVGGTVSVDPVLSEAAARVVIREPASFSGEDAGYAKMRDELIDRPVANAQPVAIAGAGPPGQAFGVAFVVGTDPVGIAVITPETVIEFVTHKDGPDAPCTTEVSDYIISNRSGGRSTTDSGFDDEDVPHTSVDDTNEFRVHPAEMPTVTYDDVGGIDEVIEALRLRAELPLTSPEVAEALGAAHTGGVLLAGPPGTGKTLLAKALANETSAAFYHVSGPEVMGMYYGEPERRIRDLFADARANAPSVVFFDEFDSLGEMRSDGPGNSVERRVVGQLLAEMDGMTENGGVVVLAATNNPSLIDSALRRPGRLGSTVTFRPPSEAGRREILAIHTRDVPLRADVDLDELAARTQGYTGADLEALVETVQERAFERHLETADTTVTNLLDAARNGVLSDETVSWLGRVVVEPADIDAALAGTTPSGLADRRVEVAETTWDDIAGHETVKARLYEAAVLPLEHPELLETMDTESPGGVLLAGPPGTGKTLLARAVATETGANFISVKGPELLNKWVGESERAVRELFETARENAPTVVFFDELDAVAPARGSRAGGTGVTDNVVAQLLTELDGLTASEDIIVIGATNRPELIDEALVRDGRFGAPMYVGLPDREARLRILELNTAEMPLAPDVDLEELARVTEGLAGSALAAACNRAGILAIRDVLGVDEAAQRPVASMTHFEQALEMVDSTGVEGMAETDGGGPGYVH